MARNLRIYLAIVLNRSFDRRLGIDTSGSIAVEDLDIGGSQAADAFEYGSTPVRSFRRMMRNLPGPVDGFTFVDFGSGKGRTILLAAEYGFRRVVGVEFSPALHETALRNVARYRERGRSQTPIEPICADATTFTIPDGPCVLYFFAPFGAESFRRVLDNVACSLRATSRTIYICYAEERGAAVPIPTRLLDASDMFERVDAAPLPFDPTALVGLKYVIYSSRF